MPDQSTPEIDALREDLCDAFAHHSMPLWERAEITDAVHAVAIQAVRDTEARVIREAVEALRERSGQSRAGADAGAGVWYEGAADFLSYRFLSHPDNPEGT